MKRPRKLSNSGFSIVYQSEKFACLRHEGTGKYKIIQFFHIAMGDLLIGSFPPFLTFKKENDVIPNAHDRAHIVGDDYCGALVFVSEFLDQLIDQNSRFRV